MTLTCSVKEDKIKLFLLNENHPKGRTRAAFFVTFGFSLEHWNGLAEALMRHFNENSPIQVDEDEYGKRLECTGPLQTPAGKNPNVLSAWIIRPDDTIADFVTAYAKSV